MAYEFLQQMMRDAPEVKPPEMIPNMLTQYTRQYFEDQLRLINNMSDHDVYNFVKSNIDYICNCIINKDVETIQALAGEKFARAFSGVVGTVPNSPIRQLCVNKVAYDYFTSDNPDPKIKRLFLDAAKAVNKDEIRDLVTVGIPTDVAANLAFSRFASVNEQINIKRLNFVICSQDPEIMTIQKITNIYEKMFDRISDLFTTTLLEYYVTEDTKDDSSFMEILGNIYYALLNIVNNMPINSIATVIETYVNAWEYAGKPRVEISLRSLSADFGRIQQVVEGRLAYKKPVP